MAKKELENDNQGDRLEILSTFVRLGILVWSGCVLTLAYIKLPDYLGIPEQKFDNTFIASIFTGTLSTFGIQAGKGGGKGGVSKEEMEKMIAAAQAPKIEKPQEKSEGKD